jgi:hypothetical protein
MIDKQYTAAEMRAEFVAGFNAAYECDMYGAEIDAVAEALRRHPDKEDKHD